MLRKIIIFSKVKFSPFCSKTVRSLKNYNDENSKYIILCLIITSNYI